MADSTTRNVERRSPVLRNFIEFVYKSRSHGDVSALDPRRPSSPIRGFSSSAGGSSGLQGSDPAPRGPSLTRRGVSADSRQESALVSSVSRVSDSEAQASTPAGNHRALLGRLAWRAGLNEPFVTDALAVLMESPILRNRLLAHLTGRFREQEWPVDMGSIERCEGQVIDKVYGRPDLVFQDADGLPVLVVEAKLLDLLWPEQVVRYLRWQGEQAPHLVRAVVLLVADHRIDAVKKAGQQAAAEVNVSESAIVVVGWSDVLKVLEFAAVELGASPRSYSADVVQFHDLVVGLTGNRLPPVTGTLGAGNWAENLDALNKLVEVVGDRVNERRGTSWNPQLQPVRDGFGPYHYVCDAQGIHYAIGPHEAFASLGLSPLWFRVSKVTANKQRHVVEALRSRLISAGRWQMRDDGDDVWVCIDIGESWDDGLADRVVEKVLEILTVAIPTNLELPGEDEAPS